MIGINHNVVYLNGIIRQEPRFSHEYNGEKYYKTTISVKRTSNESDLIPLLVPEYLLKGTTFKYDDKMCVHGEFSSYNKHYEGKSKLLLFVLVKSFEEEHKSTNNIIVCDGFICSKPIFRTTPKGKKITELKIAVNTKPRQADYLPCIAWGTNAELSKHYPVGKKVEIVGRIQSRDYDKRLENGTIETRTAYEVSIKNFIEV